MDKMLHAEVSSLEYDLESELTLMARHTKILITCFREIDSIQNKLLTTEQKSLIHQARDFFVFFRNPKMRKTMSFDEVQTKIEYYSSELQTLIIHVKGHDFYNNKIIKTTQTL